MQIAVHNGLNTDTFCLSHLPVVFQQRDLITETPDCTFGRFRRITRDYEACRWQLRLIPWHASWKYQNMSRVELWKSWREAVYTSDTVPKVSVKDTKGKAFQRDSFMLTYSPWIPRTDLFRSSRPVSGLSSLNSVAVATDTTVEVVALLWSLVVNDRM